MVAQSPEPEAHDKVLDTNPDRIGIWKCWFLRRGENWSTRRKTSRSKDEKQQQTQPTHNTESGNQTRATLVGDECSHHCAIPAPQIKLSSLPSTFLHFITIHCTLLYFTFTCVFTFRFETKFNTHSRRGQISDSPSFTLLYFLFSQTGSDFSGLYGAAIHPVQPISQLIRTIPPTPPLLWRLATVHQ